MSSGEPGVPLAFSWRSREYRVVRVVDSWKSLRDCRHGSGEKYIDKHFFKVDTENGETMTLYRARSGSKADQWILYTIESAASRTARPLKLAVLVSGGGTNLQALIDAEKSDDASCPSEARYEIVLVVADRDCFALERARQAGIATARARAPEGTPTGGNRRAISDRVLALSREAGAEALVLAGFLTIMEGAVIDEYSGKIINLHPALLPKFGGKGMWGHHVHEAVLASGETESGCTVHLVDAGCDTGPILLQRRVPVKTGDTAESLAARISGEEHEAIVEGARELARRLAARRDEDGALTAEKSEEAEN